MTSKTMTLTPEAISLERFPDFPPRNDMQNSSHLHRYAVMSAIAIHIGDPETNLVHSELPVAPTLDPWGSHRIPDLIVARNCDVAGAEELGGYAIDRQGKPPDLVLEVASPTTALNDYTDKRVDYQSYGIPEYWRFDPTGGERYDAALAGDRLVDGRYEPIEIEWPDEDHGRGYSEVLEMYICWEHGRLRFYDPETESYLLTHDELAEWAEEQTARAEDAEAEVRRLRERLEEIGEVE